MTGNSDQQLITMASRNIFLAVLFVLLEVAARSLIVHAATKTVTTNVGAIIGYSSVSNFDNTSIPVWNYLGIPYAEAPIGNLRFARPVPKARFQSVYNASMFGPACPQDLMMMQMWVPPSGKPYISEDCLSLNVFVPGGAPPSGGFPVMVWIHGGAYVIGQSSIYSAENLAAYGEVIVVSINYRLGPLGFISTLDNSAKGNFGLWDQHLALKWIHTNIQYFGGNKEKITLFGESAGGASVIYHAMFPANKGLFKRVISESGSADSAWGFGYADQVNVYTHQLGAALGCNINDTATMIHCMRGKPYQEIIKHARVASNPRDTIFRPEFVPIPDGEIISSLPLNEFGWSREMPLSSKSMFSEVDVMTGINDGDGGFITATSILPYLESVAAKSLTQSPGEVLDDSVIPLVLQDRLGHTNPYLNQIAAFVYNDWTRPQDDTLYRQRLVNISSDHFFFMPSLFTARAHAGYVSGNTTYLFRFSRRSFFNTKTFLAPGAQHGDEIAYVFGFPSSMEHSFGYSVDSIPPADRHLSYTIMTYWTNFAKTGNPNLPQLPRNTPVWPQYDITNKPYLELDIQLKTGNRLYAEREEFWLKLAPKLLASNHTTPTVNSPHVSGTIFG